MRTPTYAHCLFEQSGTFKKEFVRLGIPAADYDIRNDFGQTDHIVDLFEEIESAYDKKASLFDKIKQSDIVMAFFPCVYFCEGSKLSQTYYSINYKGMSIREKTEKILQRQKNRTYFLNLLTKLFCVAYERGLRMIVENPATCNFLLTPQNFVEPPKLIDKNRTTRGDWFRKPTAYWFVNCDPTHMHTHTHTPRSEMKTVANQKKGKQAGSCSTERSMISATYARNFICDFILGKEQEGRIIEKELF